MKRQPMSNPARLQRTRDHRETPPGTIYVGRGSRFANPFLSRRFGHARATGLHRAWLAGTLTPRIITSLGFNEYEAAALARLRRRIAGDLHLIAGRKVICWCNLTSKWCHADTLKILAERQAEALAA